jgi:tetratricopeptide (TPR) repeat protein
VSKCLAFAAEDRYASAADLVSDLRAYLGVTATTGRFINRHRRAVLAAALGVFGSIALFGGYVGTRPTQFEVLYQRGLGEYDAGEFKAAVATFTKCLELKSGSADALFGRAQALRRMENWADARADYQALRSSNRAWSFALEGYCNMRMNDDPAAWSDFNWAYRHGLRDVGFLMNFARVLSNRQMHANAAQIYTEVLTVDPRNKTAVRNRGMSLFAVVRNDKRNLPDPQAFADLEEYFRLEPNGFEAAYCAAIIHGDAARKDPSYEQKAIGYLNQAFQKGMPRELVQPYFTQLKRLLPFVDGQMVIDAVSDPDYRTRFAPSNEPSLTARWPEFQHNTGQQAALLAHRK